MKALIKGLLKRLLFRPYKVSIGRNSVVIPPRSISNKGKVKIGNDVHIGRRITLNPMPHYLDTPYAGEIRIGDGVYIGSYCQIHSTQILEIDDGAVLSDFVYISDNAHGLDPHGLPIMQQPLETKGPIKIGKKVFIGYGCSVLSGVSLGDHCVVGARSVVTKSFPAYSMVAGSPARLVKRFNHQTRQWEKV